ncbi:MAG: PAS domain S-box protein [Verrucomicrobia bacterium]|nr:PAS domain S-box protein [Verrucomicrobiota bacterium]
MVREGNKRRGRAQPGRGETFVGLAASGAATALAVGYLLLQWLAFPAVTHDSYLGRMAPLAALALAALGLADLLGRLGAERRGARGAAWAMWTFAVAVAVVVGARNHFAPQSAWDPDAWLTSRGAREQGLPVLPLSPVTALLLLASAAVLEHGWRASASGRRGRAWAVAFAMATLGFAGFSAVSRFADVPLIALGGLSVAFWPALGLASLNLSLVIQAGGWTRLRESLFGRDGPETPEEERRGRLVLAAVVGIWVLLLAASYLLLRSLNHRALESVDASLTNVAELKLEQIASWRRERAADAATLARSPWGRMALEESATGAGLRGAVRQFFDEMRENYGYSAIFLLVLDRPPVVSSSEASAAHLRQTEWREKLSAAGGGVAEDLYLGADGRVWLDFMAALPPEPGRPGLGVVVLRQEARRGLFPFISRWPAPTRSGEVYLTRREGDGFRYISDVSHHERAAFRLVVAPGDPRLRARRTLRVEGSAPLLEIRDYRNVSTLVTAREVPGTDWILNVKLDKVEALAEVRADAWSIAGSLVVVLGAVAWFMRRSWRQRERSFEQQRRVVEAKERATMERLGAVLRHANDSLLIFDEEQRIVEANDRTVTAYGYSPAELLQLRVTDLRAADAAGTIPGEFAKALTPGGIVLETRHRRKDGSEFPVEVSARPVVVDGRRFVLSIVRDISERRAHELEIERLNRLYQVISQINQALVRAKSEAELFAAVCRVLVEQGGFQIAWVGWFNPQTRRLDAVAVAGDEQGYVAGLEISADPDRPEGLGPTGKAFRSGQTQLCSDFFADPSTEPWRDQARKSGFQASAALPLFEAGKPRGVLTVYAAERNYFQGQQLTLLEEAAGDISFALDAFTQETRRREAEAALQASEHRLQFLLTATPAVIFTLRAADFGISYLSDNVYDLTGFRPQDFAQDPGFWRMRLHSEDATQLTAVEALLRAGQPTVHEFRFRRADGSYRWMRDEIRPVVGTDGKITEMVGFWIDVNERKEAEGELRKLSLALEQSPVSVVITDLGGAIEYVNARFTEVTGFTPAEVKGLNPRVLKSGLTPPAVFADLWQTISSGRVWRGEIINCRKDGGLFTELAVITPVTNAAGIPTHYVALKEDISARKQMEDTLRESERRYRLIADNSSDIFWLYNLVQRRFEYISPSVFRLRGLRPEEALQGRLLDSLTPGSAAEVARLLPARLAAFSAGDPQAQNATYELEFRRRDGSSFPAEVTTTLVADAAGRPVQLIGVTHDISERKAAERELRESEQRLRTLIEKVPVPIAYMEPSGRISLRNARFIETFGYSEEEVPDVAAWWARAYPDPAYQARVRADWEQMAQEAAAGQRSVVPSEYQVTCRDGTVRTVEISGIALGRALLVTQVDLTARKQAEAELRKLSRSIEQAPLSVMITDLNGAIEYVNPKFCEVTGYTFAEVRGQNPRVLKTEQTPAEIHRAMWQTLVSGQVWHGELHNRKKNGETYVERAVVAPIVDEHGKPTHFVALKEDITGQKRTEDALRETQERYRLIAENTSDVIWLYDLARQEFSYLSPATERLLGVKAQDLVGKPISQVLSPAALAQVLPVLRARIAAFNAGDHSLQNWNTVLEHLHAEGRIVLGEVVTTLIADERGRAEKLLGISRDVTERQHAAAELQRSRDRLAEAERMAHLGNWELDLAANCLSWSDEIYRIFEIDRSEFGASYEAFLALIHPEDRQLVHEAYQRSLQAHTPFVVGHRLRFPDGRIKYVHESGHTVYSEDGRPVRSVGTMQDVSVRKEVELRLHELVKDLRVLHGVGQTVQRRDLSEEALLAEVVRHLPQALRAPERAQAGIECRGRVYQAGAVGETSERIVAPLWINDQEVGLIYLGVVGTNGEEGERFAESDVEVVESVARTLGLGLGARESFAAVQRFNEELEAEVTRRTAELETRTREMQALLESVPDMVVQMRLDGTLLHWQQAKERTALSKRGTAAGVGEGMGAAGELRVALLRLGHRAVEAGATVSEESVLASSAEPLTVELRAAPVGREEFVVFVRDITERKRLEAEVAATLEKERQVSEMKTRFISVTSHEFRTPMAAAVGTIELLHHHLDRLSVEKRAEMFARISNSLHRMSEMLDDILLLNRVDAGRVKVRPESLHLSSLVQSIVDEVRMADRDAHRFAVEGAGEAGRFNSDPAILHHILSNLLSNAARYSPAGTVVTIRLAVTREGLRLAVEDQGIGVPEKDRARLFEAFERGSNVGAVKGTGLGLNIVKRMTELLGGRVWYEPAEGRGSRFVLEVPPRS